MIKGVLKKSSQTSLKNKTNHSLSIQFSLDGFSFCIYKTATNETIHFSRHDFEERLNSSKSLLDKIKIIFAENNLLHDDFDTITVIHQNDLQTFVPSEFFQEERLGEYLNFNIKTLPNDFIAFDSIEAIDIKNIFIPFVNINNFLFHNFGAFEYKHHLTVLLEKLLEKDAGNEKTMYVNVAKNTIDIVVLASKKLLLCNQFSFITKEDFIYYILFVSEQLHLDNKLFNLFLTGDINSESALYELLYKYVKNIFFIENSNPIFSSLDCEPHSNFLLLS